MEIIAGVILGLWLMFIIWMTLIDGPNFGYARAFVYALILPVVAVKDLWNWRKNDN